MVLCWGIPDPQVRVYLITVLQMPDPDNQFVEELGASDVGVGVVLSQRSASGQKLHPCTFFLRHLSPAERNYDSRNRELAMKLS